MVTAAHGHAAGAGDFEDGVVGLAEDLQEAFDLAGVEDPTPYDDADYWIDARRAYSAKHLA